MGVKVEVLLQPNKSKKEKYLSLQLTYRPDILDHILQARLATTELQPQIIKNEQGKMKRSDYGTLSL